VLAPVKGQAPSKQCCRFRTRNAMKIARICSDCLVKMSLTVLDSYPAASSHPSTSLLRAAAPCRGSARRLLTFKLAKDSSTLRSIAPSGLRVERLGNGNERDLTAIEGLTLANRRMDGKDCRSVERTMSTCRSISTAGVSAGRSKVPPGDAASS